MEDTVNILIPSNNGSYTFLRPNFELFKFETTKKTINGRVLTPFGFIFNLKFSESYPMIKTISTTEVDEIKKNLFKKIYDELQQRALINGSDYVVIDNLDCVSVDIKRPYKVCRVSIECQFFLNIKHEHIPPTVFAK
jgi:hypothetical protein